MDYLWGILLVGGSFIFLLCFFGLMIQTHMVNEQRDNKPQEPTVYQGRRDRKIQR